MKGKYGRYISFCLLALILGLGAGSAVWGILRVMDLGIDFVWESLPGILGCGRHPAYYLAAGVAGGVLIGLWRKKYGPLPDTMEQVLGKVKGDGSYPYDRIHIIIVAALLPLIAGGALGPEAGLSGVIAGLCCMIGDDLKYKADRVVALAETGFIAAVTVIFGAPFFGIAHSLEPDDRSETYRQRLVSKKHRIIIYAFSAAGAMAAFKGLGILTGVSGGIARFAFKHAVGIGQWKWAIPLIAAGILFALYFTAMEGLFARISERFEKYDMALCVAAGILVALCGFFVPLSMFSGEKQLGALITDWQSYTAAALVTAALVKIFLVNACIGLGWRGGSIFPMIFSGAMMGYAFALVTGMDGAFAAAVMIASFYSYIVRKPVAVIAILFMCFPVSYILPVAVSAFIAAKVPPARLPGLGQKSGK